MVTVLWGNIFGIGMLSLWADHREGNWSWQRAICRVPGSSSFWNASCVQMFEFTSRVCFSTTLALANSMKVAWVKMYCLSLFYYINLARYPNSLRLHLYKRNDRRVQGRRRPEPSQSHECLIVPCQLSLTPLVCKYPISLWSSSVLQMMKCFLVVNLDFVVKVPTRSSSPQLHIFQGEKSNLNQNRPISPHGGETALEGTVCQ
jgi:hypothetical protein